MTILYTSLIFIFGSLLTSFYLVLGERLPKNESINGRSHCDTCHHDLRWIDIIPIFGYLINKGKCHFCKSKIPICHLLLELLGGALFSISYLIYGFSFELAILLVFISVFMIESVSDRKYMIVLDRIWMIGIIPLIIIRIIQGEFLSYLISSAVLFSILFIIAYLSQKVYKKDTLGGGDVKLFIFIGFILTIGQGLLALFMTSLFGFIYGIIKLRTKHQEFPLVPFIFIGVMISYLYGQDIINWYLSLLRM
ncbi:MAG: prepilin peptidase [Firmicutes bacterium]|nr:prepilin peptidase [Bacillota bacterium]